MKPTMDSDSAAIALRGRWLLFARAAWVAAVVLTVVLFVAAAPIFLAELRTPCAGTMCQRYQLTPALAQALRNLGLSLDFYAVYNLALNAAAVSTFCTISAVVFWRGADERMALFGAFTLVTMVSPLVDILVPLRTGGSGWWWPTTFMSFLGSTCLFIFFYLFPDGRFVPRWTRWAAAAWVVMNVILYFSPPDWALNQSNPLSLLVILGFFVSVVAVQIHRYRRVSGPVQRQQTKWVVFGFTAAFVVFFINVMLIVPRLDAAGSSSIVARLAVFTSFPIFQLLIPLSIGIAVLRYRLWDIDIVINRALVYGALTAAVVGVYVLVVGYLGALFRTGGNLAISLLATGIVAVLFAPLRERLQRGVNRMMYGKRDDPYAVISRLGERLEGTLEQGAVLPAVVETVAQALRLPYAAIALRQSGERAGSVVAAAHGSPVESPVRLPLSYRNEPVGELLLAPRVGEEGFSSKDRRLLDGLARQAGVAAHAVRLTDDLQRARERLVAAREEERRRLRRDLHDGLGPQLSSQTLIIDAVRSLMRESPDSAEALLLDLKAQAQDAISDIRRLVYELRPPALDDLGLAGALRAAAAQYGHGGLNVSVEAPEQLPSLPAAVEVAAYRIVQEAITNVARHAVARTCSVSLRMDEEARMLRLEVRDDGRGMGESQGTGVGLTSMRERAEELGGSFAVEASPGGGTVVRAGLPAPEEG